MPQQYSIGTSVFVRKEDEILILKRALGEAVGITRYQLSKNEVKAQLDWQGQCNRNWMNIFPGVHVG